MVEKSHSDFRSVLQYAYDLKIVMIRKGIPEEHATDAANNVAFPLAVDPKVDTIASILQRLNRQKTHFGLDVSDFTIAFAAIACGMIERPKFEE